MFKQLLQNSFTILRRPIVKTFQEVSFDNWQWALIYVAIGTVLTTLITMATNFLQAPAREQQRLEIMKQFGENNFTSLLNNMQNPLFTLALGIFGFFFVILLWIL